MLALKDKTVLITRSANQVTEFTEQLQSLGAKTIALPLIENTAINQQELLNKMNSTYQWIIFTSTNAVHFFFETITPAQVKAKIAVVGEKTKDVLNEYGLKSDFIPSEFTAKLLANEIPIKKGESILIPRSNLAKNDIVEILESRSSKIETISIYQNKSILYSKEELNNIFNQQIDYITFTSGSIVESFVALEIQLTNEKIICIGPETAIVAESNQLPITAIANPHTTNGMVKAIVDLN